MPEQGAWQEVAAPGVLMLVDLEAEVEMHHASTQLGGNNRRVSLGIVEALLR